jgi:hypothetical protein
MDAIDAPAVGVRGDGTLGSRLRRERRRRFVGREDELALVRDALAGRAEWAVMFLHAPGGVGKSALLGRIADEAEDAGVPVLHVDARAIAPSPSGFLDALARELGVSDRAAVHAALRDDGMRLLLIDTYEHAAALDAWLREELLPGLGAATRVVVAGREPPDTAWRADPGWSAVLRVVSLRNLDRAETGALLAARGVGERLHDRLFELTYGHPLALSLLADVLRQRAGENLHDLADAPDTMRALLERFVAGVPSPRHREALEVCAHARVTTRDLLASVLGGDDADALFEWLADLAWVERGPEGLAPHDLARDVLDADLRWRDESAYRRLHGRIREHVVERLRTGAARRAEHDLLFLHRTNPAVRGFWDWMALGEARADAVRPSDHAALLAMTERFEGSESAAIAERWLDRQPRAFIVFRAGDEPEPIGFCLRLDLGAASDADRAADPGALAMWTYANAHAPPRPGEEVFASRMLVDRDAYQGPSRSLNAVTARSVVEWMGNPRLSWDFIGAWADPDAVAPLMRHIDFHRAEEADYEVGGRRYGVFAHDWRRKDIDAWLEELGGREIDAAPPPEAPVPPLVLSRSAFTAAVREALRALHRPVELRASPLVRSRMVRDRDSQAAPEEALEALLREAAAAIAADPRDERLHRVLDRTYLRPAPTQERAAELLGLPSSTYRRHLSRAVERVADHLWELELYGRT